jgi:hypothetical protein
MCSLIERRVAAEKQFIYIWIVEKRERITARNMRRGRDKGFI